MRRIRKRYGNSIYWVAAFIGCAIFSVAMLAGVLLAVNGNISAQQQLENGYKRSFYEMADSVNEIEINLSKMLVSGSEEQNIELAEEIRVQTQAAQANMNQLPMDEESAFYMNKFLSQVGDFCKSYCRCVLSDGEVSVYEDKLEVLYDVASKVNGEIREMSSEVTVKNRSILGGIRRKGIRVGSELALGGEGLRNKSIEYPELIYDGVFSDLEGEPCYKGLDNLAVISESEAIAKASELFKDMAIRNIRLIAQTSRPNSYDFFGDIKGGVMYFSISVNGGKLLSVNTDLGSSGEKVTKEEAIVLAKEYARRSDYCDNLEAVWYNSVDGVAYINLAPVKGGVVHYPDLVKVKVGLDDGKLIALEALGYCTHCCKRDLNANIDEKTAKSIVSPKLVIRGSRLAIIPDGKTERLCYEIAACYKNLDYHIYIDALTSKQIKILRTISTEQGEMII